MRAQPGYPNGRQGLSNRTKRKKERPCYSPILWILQLVFLLRTTSVSCCDLRRKNKFLSMWILKCNCWTCPLEVHFFFALYWAGGKRKTFGAQLLCVYTVLANLTMWCLTGDKTSTGVLVVSSWLACGLCELLMTWCQSNMFWFFLS